MPDNGMPNTPDLAQATKSLEDALRAFATALKSAPAPRSGGNANGNGGPVFAALRQWRTEQARAKQLPPYVIATDAVLHAIEDARPASLEELKAVRGVGMKAETYGRDILEIVAKAA